MKISMKKYEEVRNYQKKIFNWKFKIIFLILIAVLVLICVRLGIDSKISAFIGSGLAVIFTSIWKSIHEEKE